MNETIHSVALVDDHELVRTGLAAMVDRIGGYRVTLEAANGKELIRALSGVPEPRIAIVDLHMPVMDGYETIAWMREHTPEILPLALTFDPADDVLVKAVRAGARGFLRKNARPALLKVALDSLILTGYYHSDEVHNTVLESGALKTTYERQQEKVLAAITPREREFLLLVCSPEEPTYEQVADAMGVQRRTVEGFREAISDKFGIKSKTGLVLFAMKWGLVKP